MPFVFPGSCATQIMLEFSVCGFCGSSPHAQVATLVNLGHRLRQQGHSDAQPVCLNDSTSCSERWGADYDLSHCTVPSQWAAVSPSQPEKIPGYPWLQTMYICRLRTTTLFLFSAFSAPLIHLLLFFTDFPEQT